MFEYKRQKNINTHIPVLKNRLFGLKVTVQWWCLLCKMCAWCSSCLYFLCLCTHALTVCLSTWRHACSLTRMHIQCCVPHMFTCTSLLLSPPPLGASVLQDCQNTGRCGWGGRRGLCRDTGRICWGSPNSTLLKLLSVLTPFLWLLHYPT